MKLEFFAHPAVYCSQFWLHSLTLSKCHQLFSHWGQHNECNIMRCRRKIQIRQTQRDPFGENLHESCFKAAKNGWKLGHFLSKQVIFGCILHNLHWKIYKLQMRSLASESRLAKFYCRWHPLISLSVHSSKDASPCLVSQDGTYGKTKFFNSPEP